MPVDKSSMPSIWVPSICKPAARNIRFADELATIYSARGARSMLRHSLALQIEVEIAVDRTISACGSEV